MIFNKMINSFAFIPISATIRSTSSSIASNTTTIGNLPPVSLLNNKSIPMNNTYTNKTAGISVTVPQGWGVEAGENSNNATDLKAIHLTPPISLDPNALTDVWVYKDTNPGATSSVGQYLRDTIDTYRSSLNNFKLGTANTGITVAGQPGYQLQLSFSTTEGPFNALESGTLMNMTAYYVYYAAPPNLFSTFLPQVNAIIQSLKVNPP
jgi:hypothetical protein